MWVVVHLCLKGCPYGFFWSHPSSSSSTWNRKKWTPKSQNKQEKILQSLLSSIKSRFFSYITTLHFLKTRGQSQWSYQPYDESDVHNGQSVLKKKILYTLQKWEVYARWNDPTKSSKIVIYYYNKTQSYFFLFSYRASFTSIISRSLSSVNTGHFSTKWKVQILVCSTLQYGEFWSISLVHFIKHISEESSAGNKFKR